ncbi:hypothetical protein GCM10010381_03710 [Streptomyces xantholiticus]|nr:hypothetical protein GCM10010381_03710 [Streptomyces xantholiticus]
MTPSAARSDAPPGRSRRALPAGSVGNFVEWYEFGVYGYFATITAANLFTPEGGSDVEAKDLFHAGSLREALSDYGTLAPEDVVATLTRLTARTVADALRPLGVSEVFASGGGTRNPPMMAALRAEPAGTPLRTSDELGVPVGAKKAYAFAVLGFLTVHGLAGTVPACTEARTARVLGSLTPGTRPPQLPCARGNLVNTTTFTQR